LLGLDGFAKTRSAPMSPSRFEAVRPAARALAVCAVIALCGCAKIADVTGSIGPQKRTALPNDENELRRFADDWGRRYDADSKNKTVALTYARALTRLERHAQAVAVLQGLAIRYPDQMDVLAAYGKALADSGRLQEAAEVLARAHTPERPDWSVLSAQGSIADQLGNHEEARGYYEAALKIRPNEATVLSNLGLSYALSKQLPQAEQTLLIAAAQPGADMRVRQNLALVLALQGKFDQAENWSRHDLPPIDAAANVASIRQMIAQSNSWREIQNFGARAGKQRAPRTRVGVTSSAPSPE
jgi:Flp pilus assembly protein TadD